MPNTYYVHTKSRGLIFAILRSLSFSGQVHTIYPSALGLHWFSLGQTLVLKMVVFVIMELLKRLHLLYQVWVWELFSSVS